MTLTRDALLASVQRRKAEAESAVFGGALLYQELTRAELRAALKAGETEPDADGVPQTLLEPYHAYVFAAGVIDEAGMPVWTGEQVRDFPIRDGMTEEISRVAGLILALSEQQPDAVKKKLES